MAYIVKIDDKYREEWMRYPTTRASQGVFGANMAQVNSQEDDVIVGEDEYDETDDDESQEDVDGDATERDEEMHGSRDDSRTSTRGDASELPNPH